MKSKFKLTIILSLIILAISVSVLTCYAQDIDCRVYSPSELRSIVDVNGPISADFIFDGNTTAINVVNNGVGSLTGEYVIFEFYPSNMTESNYEPEFLIKNYPIVRISYKTDINATSMSINAGMKASSTGNYERFWGLKRDITADGKYHSVIYDLSTTSNFDGGTDRWAQVTSDSGIKYVRIPVWAHVAPEELSASLGEYINIEYIAFFKTLADANRFVYEGDPLKPLGDADKDGEVTLLDTVMLARYLAKWADHGTDKVNVSALDINDDGKVNSMDAVILSRHLANWIGYKDLFEFNPGYSMGDYVQKLLKMPDGLIEELDAKFAQRVEKIRASESEYTVGSNAKVYYVANNGSDSYNGLSTSRPFKTLSHVESLMSSGTIKAGDVVLLRRGDEWHHQFTISKSITLSAYGEGEKPRILGSIEADRASQWMTTGVSNVYKFNQSMPTTSDVGNIVFNNGEAYGMRIIKDENNKSLPVGRDDITSNGINRWEFPVQEFTGYQDLAKIGEAIPEADLMYYHDRENELLYLYCREGNPGNVFDSIELCRKGHTIRVNKDNVVVDNILFGYTGSHGLSSSSRKNLTVRNCEVCWIGGSVQNDDINVRFGNAVEIYGSADGFYVYDNYMYQCFDCGPTVQVTTTLTSGKQVYQKNIEFYGNALAEASLEVWLTSSPANTSTTFAKLVNCRMYDNYVTMSGYGWKGYNHQKNEWCSFYGAGNSYAEYIDCYMENNYFWNLRRHLLKAVDTHTTNGLGIHWRNNVIIKEKESMLGQLGSNLEQGSGSGWYIYNERTLNKMLESGAFGENTFYYIPEYYDYEIYQGPDYGNLAQLKN